MGQTERVHDEVYVSAAHAFARLVRVVGDALGDPPAWDGPGLGEWDLRALVGHTGRALVTVETYLQRPATAVAAETAAEYVALIRDLARRIDPSDVAERGRAAGAELGPDPVAAVAELVERVLATLEAVDGDPVIETIVGGMHLREYLRTRSFELAVHSLDIVRVTGVEVQLPPAVAAAALSVAAEAASAQGRSPEVLLALTGREPLPTSFSIL